MGFEQDMMDFEYWPANYSIPFDLLSSMLLALQDIPCGSFIHMSRTEMNLSEDCLIN